MEQMPKEIAAAIVLVMRAIGRLVKDGKNQHGGYSYASTDAFLEAINPACAEAGLIVKPRCVSSEVVTVEVFDKTSKSTIPKRMVQATYAFILIHESGSTWSDDAERRTIMLDHTGPQSFGAAESYAVKTFMRSLFLVATGDKDADAQEQHQAEVIRATVKAVKAKKETGEGQILIDFGNGMEPISASDVQTRVLTYMAELGEAKACSDWWTEQKHGPRTISQRVSEAGSRIEAQSGNLHRVSLSRSRRVNSLVLPCRRAKNPGERVLEFSLARA